MNHSLVAANYNCTDSANSAYGAGDYNTCATTTIPEVAAPNTGSFWLNITGGHFTILLALVLAIAIVAGTAVIRKKKARR